MKIDKMKLYTVDDTRITTNSKTTDIIGLIEPKSEQQLDANSKVFSLWE